MNEEYHDLVQKATDELKRMHYTQGSISKYLLCWNRFKEYLIPQNSKRFSDSEESTNPAVRVTERKS